MLRRTGVTIDITACGKEWNIGNSYKLSLNVFKFS
jgi:hypothetical protein